MSEITLNNSLFPSNIWSEQTILRYDSKEEEIKRLKSKLSMAIEEIEKRKKKVELPERYIINENATILFWKDGTKTVVRKCEDDEFNPRLGFLTAFFQHYCGMSKNKANKYLAQLNQEMPKEKETQDNFKIGSRVKALKTDSRVKKGWIGSITGFFNNTTIVRWDNGEEWCQLRSDLELIEKGAK